MLNHKKGKPEYKLLLVMLGIFIVGSLLIGVLIQTIIGSITGIASGQGIVFEWSVLLQGKTWMIGIIFFSLALLVMWIGGSKKGILGIGLFGGKSDGTIESVLENSRFLTDKERNQYFPTFSYSKIEEVKKDGVPVRAIMDKKGDLTGNIMSGIHSLVIGATGSGKTTTFINPMIQIIGATNCGSSMILTDPKGELFSLHSKFLKDRGYDVKLLDLRDTYSSSRWNPLSGIWDRYQEYLQVGNNIKVHKDLMEGYSNLKVVDGYPKEGEIWCEWSGRAYADLEHCQDDVTILKQKIYDEMYEDLNDLVSVICPITNEKDPLWEKGARSMVMALCLGMLEDSEDVSMGMTKDKFNFFNINKAFSNSENDFQVLREYFMGRNSLSPAVTLSKQVLSAAEATMSSYMSIAFDKLNIFNDRGICGLTSKTDIYPEEFAKRKTALFMKIPDEKDTRHGLAAAFILCIYKALIKVASAEEELTLPRDIYFLLDEFGNMPKIEKFDKMITVGRSRKLWFNMVVQSYAQLKNVYGEEVADIIKSNCGLKMFIGSNDIETCKEFSELCGNKSVQTTSASTNLGSQEGEGSVSTQLQSRPLIYPSELQKLNNKESTGNAIIVTFGNHPLKTKYTPSYQCPLYQMGQMDMDEIRSNVFRPDQVFYDLSIRNQKILS